MKKLIYIILLGSVLLLMSACESGGKFNMINRTSFPVYASVDGGGEVTIPAQTSHIFNVDTDSQSFLTGEVKRRVSVHVKGETFSLYDEEENRYVDDTVTTIKAGKTTNAYLDPNRASIKIVNDRPEMITKVMISRVSPTTSTVEAILEGIPSGETMWHRVKYATLQDNFYYKLDVWMEGVLETLVYYADDILGNDEQWVLHVGPREDENI